MVWYLLSNIDNNRTDLPAVCTAFENRFGFLNHSKRTWQLFDASNPRHIVLFLATENEAIVQFAEVYFDTIEEFFTEPPAIEDNHIIAGFGKA